MSRVSPRINEEFTAKGNDFDTVVIRKTGTHSYQVFGIKKNGNKQTETQITEGWLSLRIARYELRKYGHVEIR